MHIFTIQIFQKKKSPNEKIDYKIVNKNPYYCTHLEFFNFIKNTRKASQYYN